MSNNQELEKQIREAVKKYKESGGGDFYIISQKDHDRNWLEAKRQVGLALINKIEELLESASPELSDLGKDTPKIEDYETEEEWDTDCNIVNALRMGRNSAIQEFNSELREALNKLKQEAKMSKKEEPKLYSQAQVDAFIREAVKEAVGEANSDTRWITMSNTDKKVLVDADDYDKIMAHGRWYMMQGYAVRGNGSGHTRMHRVINNTPKGVYTDHINRDKLDNRKANLMNASPAVNSQNGVGFTHTKHKGLPKRVTWCYEKNKYLATYSIRKGFVDLEEAVEFTKTGQLSKQEEGSK